MGEGEERMNSSDRELIAEILKIAEDIVGVVPMGIPLEYLNSDMTIAQLRILLVLQTQGPSRMGSIASITGVTLPTATGVVENEEAGRDNTPPARMMGTSKAKVFLR